MADEYSTGECLRCGENGTIFADNSLCEFCDIDTIVCRICGTREDRDDHCRHVFRTQWSEWAGSGTGYQIEQCVRDSFVRLVQQMPPGFRTELRAAIEREKFHTFFCGPLIGGGGSLELHGLCGPTRVWGDMLIAIGDGDFAEDTVDGYMWLASLYDNLTPEAAAATAKMLDDIVSMAVTHG